MSARSSLKAYFDGFAHKLGEYTATLIWGAVFFVAPILAWLVSPIGYAVNLTRLGAAGTVLALMIVIAFTAWFTRRLSVPRRKYHLTPIGAQNIWGIAAVPDGSVNAQFSAHFVAKNLSDSDQHLIVARMVKPRIEGTLNHSTVITSGGSIMTLRPKTSGTLTVNILVQGARNLPKGDIDAVIALADDEGYEQCVKVRIRDMSPRAPV